MQHATCIFTEFDYYREQIYLYVTSSPLFEFGANFLDTHQLFVFDIICLHNEPQISSRGISIIHAWLEFSQNFNNKKSLSTSFKIGANFLDMCQLITAVCLFHHFDNNVNVNNNHYHHLIQNSRKRLKIHHAWLAFSRNLIKKS